MSLDSQHSDATDVREGETSPRSIRARVNDACLRQLDADGVLDDARREKLRAMLNAGRPPKAEEFVSLFEETSDEAVQ